MLAPSLCSWATARGNNGQRCARTRPGGSCAMKGARTAPDAWKVYEDQGTFPGSPALGGNCCMAAGKSETRAARMARPPEEGLLLLYPISRHSGHDLDGSGPRRP